MLDFIVMQMSKGNREKGYSKPYVASETWRFQRKRPSNSQPIHSYLPSSSSSRKGSSSLCPTLGHAEKYDHKYCEVRGGCFGVFFLLVFLAIT